jgi:hypothetical protein
MRKGKPPWIRYRFHCNEEDPRPVIFPPPGPWWCTGFGEDYALVVAYLPVEIPLTKYWPEATEVESTEEDGINFSERFPVPSWWGGISSGRR